LIQSLCPVSRLKIWGSNLCQGTKPSLPTCHVLPFFQVSSSLDKTWKKMRLSPVKDTGVSDCLSVREKYWSTFQYQAQNEAIPALSLFLFCV